MNHRDKILSLRVTIELIVKNTTGVTTKYLAELFNLSYSHMKKVIRDMDNIHRQNDVLYYGEIL